MLASSALLSAIVVTIVIYLLSEGRKRRNELSGLRLRAYSDFINSASRLVKARRSGNTYNELDDLAALNDAKTRICMSAPPSVVEALTDFWERGGAFETEQEILAFCRLCMSIRESLGNEYNDVGSLNLSDTLFKLEPSSYSLHVARGNGA